MSRAMHHTDVAIVGGGPVGLAMSMLLSHHGVEHRLYQRHDSTTFHPKARNLNTRTMEILRPLGLTDAMDAIALGPEWCSSIAYCVDLVGPELGRMSTGAFVGIGDDVSPVAPHLSSQDVYEPIWRDRAEDMGVGQLAFGRSVTAVSDSGDEVVLEIDGPHGAERCTAQYLVGCDGWNSTVRHHLGIELEGRKDLAQFVNVYFRADLSDLVGDRPAVLFFTTEPRGVFQPLDGAERWLCQITHLHDSDPLSVYDHERCIEWVRAAAGDAGREVEIISVGTWTMNATTAERYRVGRCFMAGDSVHQLPPTGGFGANTGIQDAHNLAWKLAAVLRGEAGDALLDTYETERRPVAEFNAIQSLENSRMVGRITEAALRGDDAALEVGRSTRYGNFTGMELGYHYESEAVVADGSPAVVAEDPIVDYVPTSRPGHRMPHAWIDERAGVSTHDLLSSRLTLLGTDAEVLDASAVAAAAIGAHLDPVPIAADVMAQLHDVPGALLLVRPDGHVAWRSDPGSGASQHDAAAVADAARQTLAL